ncbi:MAG: hypothetical protein IPG53_11935 [Ignavibacteriales bacterium]|nr:hypothetical protein [Ignavibacteriales bacterium]
MRNQSQDYPPKRFRKIIRAAFEFARQNKRKKVTIVHKANVVRANDGLFFSTSPKKLKKIIPKFKWMMPTDAITTWLLKIHNNYDVLQLPIFLVISFPICSAQTVGGLGFGCSGNIGEKLALFEPTRNQHLNILVSIKLIQ